MEEGKLDVYVSCSLRNDHQFIRLGKGDRGKSIELPSNVNYRLSPYITKHGNVSFKIAPEEDGPIKNLLNFFMP
ncbi:hypothetical protein WD019_06730 [Fictibacillus sp. Mic-4]|uniref:hypothetical protein n=1 Tax=Fictibacillus sp. Mic-4 TaxID=3132826 RepID=UPI003CF50EA5